MGRSYSIDLRRRVVERVAGGQSRRGAAEDLSVSPSFSVKLVARHERTGSLEPAPQGRPPGTGKLARYRDFLIGRVKEKPDITMPELAAETWRLVPVPAGLLTRLEPDGNGLRKTQRPLASHRCQDLARPMRDDAYFARDCGGRKRGLRRGGSV